MKKNSLEKEAEVDDERVPWNCIPQLKCKLCMCCGYVSFVSTICVAIKYDFPR